MERKLKERELARLAKEEKDKIEKAKKSTEEKQLTPEQVAENAGNRVVRSTLTELERANYECRIDWLREKNVRLQLFAEDLQSRNTSLLAEVAILREQRGTTSVESGRLIPPAEQDEHAEVGSEVSTHERESKNHRSEDPSPRAQSAPTMRKKERLAKARKENNAKRNQTYADQKRALEEAAIAHNETLAEIESIQCRKGFREAKDPNDAIEKHAKRAEKRVRPNSKDKMLLRPFPRPEGHVNSQIRSFAVFCINIGVYTQKFVAFILGVDERTVYRWVELGFEEQERQERIYEHQCIRDRLVGVLSPTLNTWRESHPNTVWPLAAVMKVVKGIEDDEEARTASRWTVVRALTTMGALSVRAKVVRPLSSVNRQKRLEFAHFRETRPDIFAATPCRIAKPDRTFSLLPPVKKEIDIVKNGRHHPRSS